MRPLIFILVDVSDIFYFFYSEEGKGESKAAGRGGGGKSQEGGSPGWVGERGREGVCGEFGGGAKYFFRGRNSHQVMLALTGLGAKVKGL